MRILHTALQHAFTLFQDRYTQLAVIHQDRTADLDIVKDLRALDVELFMRSQDLLTNDRHDLAFLIRFLSVFKIPQTDLRSLGIQQDRNALARLFYDLTDVLDTVSLFLLITM